MNKDTLMDFMSILALIFMILIVSTAIFTRTCEAKGIIKINRTTIAEMIKLKKFTINDNIYFKGRIGLDRKGRILKGKIIVFYKWRF